MGLSFSLNEIREVEVYETNITHNLNKMAQEAGVYEILWRPEEVPVTRASEMIEKLEKAIEDMRKRPDHYRQFDASNGWGTYNDFLPWLERTLEACREFPDSRVEASR